MSTERGSDQRKYFKTVCTGAVLAVAGVLDGCDITGRRSEIEQATHQVFPRPTVQAQRFAQDVLAMNPESQLDEPKKVLMALEIKAQEQKFQAKVDNRYAEKYFYRNRADAALLIAGLLLMAGGVKLEERENKARLNPPRNTQASKTS